MVERGRLLLSDFASNLYVSDKKSDLEKIIAAGNYHLTQIDEQQMAVLLLVRRTDIVKLSRACEKFVHFSAVGGLTMGGGFIFPV